MPVYEFECPKGHVTDDLVSIGTKEWPCSACAAEARARGAAYDPAASLAKRILSPTRTDFEFADKRR